MAAGKSDVLVKLVLVFFISLLSFSIGTFVGKNYSDNQHRRAALEPDAQSQSRSTASTEHGETSHESTMSDDEISKLAEEFAEEETATETVAANAHHEAKAPAAAPTTAHHEAKSPAAENKAVTPAAAATTAPAKAKQEVAASTPAQNIVAGKAAVPSIAQKAHQESRLPSSIPKDVAQYSVGKFTVQIASFPTETDAKNRAEELKTKGYSAFYVPANVKGKTWYRVSVGLFATEDEAKTYRLDFMDKNKVGTAIIQKITN